VVIGSSALQLVKGLYRYTDLMAILPHMAFDIFLCLSYQFDVYCFSALHIFSKEEEYQRLFWEGA
jgi:hypothetical protein